MQPSGSAATDQFRFAKSAASWGLTLGLVAFVVLIVAHGVRDVAAALAAAGGGIVVVTLSHLAPLITHAIGWRSVLAGEYRPALRRFVWGRWLGESVNDLLPVLQVGGAVVRGRALVGAGVAATTAGASVVVDITLILATQVAFTLIGFCLLVLYLDAYEVAGQVLAGVGLTLAALGSFVLLQRRGMFGLMARLLERLAHAPEWLTLVSSAAAFDTEVNRLYRRRRTVIAASAWQLLAWLLSASEVWLALYYLGHPVSVAAAIMWESLGEAIRAAAFAIPGALGVQEGSYLLFGSLVGVPPDVALALSLLRRVRELVLGVPGLLAWRVQRSTAGVSQRRLRQTMEIE